MSKRRVIGLRRWAWRSVVCRRGLCLRCSGSLGLVVAVVPLLVVRSAGLVAVVLTVATVLLLLWRSLSVAAVLLLLWLSLPVAVVLDVHVAHGGSRRRLDGASLGLRCGNCADGERSMEDSLLWHALKEIGKRLRCNDLGIGEVFEFLDLVSRCSRL